MFPEKKFPECWVSNLWQLGPEESLLTIVLCCSHIFYLFFIEKLVRECSITKLPNSRNRRFRQRSVSFRRLRQIDPTLKTSRYWLFSYGTRFAFVDCRSHNSFPSVETRVILFGSLSFPAKSFTKV